MDNKNRIELNPEQLEQVNGGSLTFVPDSNGNYTMKCGFSGQVFTGLPMGQAMQIVRYSATIPDTAEGEQQILSWARSQGII
ncbi:MAG: hypothetical protein IKO52_02110 [Clostridia bacterium]|nr:hypothetical protein [Clostridia bacterium]